MLYFLLYILIGMIYTGSTFKGTVKYITKSNFSENEIKEIQTKNHKELDDAMKVKMIGVLLFSLIVSAAKIFFYPVFIAAKISKK
jgi:hypothetical protein